MKLLTNFRKAGAIIALAFFLCACHKEQYFPDVPTTAIEQPVINKPVNQVFRIDGLNQEIKYNGKQYDLKISNRRTSEIQTISTTVQGLKNGISDTLIVSDGTPIVLNAEYDDFLLCIQQPYIKRLTYGFGGGGIRSFYKSASGAETLFYSYVNPALMSDPFEIGIRYTEEAQKPDTCINYDVRDYQRGYSYTYDATGDINKKKL